MARDEAERTDSTILTLEDVTFAYHAGNDVICGVTAEVRAGHVCAVLGPNASGKTTLLQLALGARRPTAGAVRLDGVDVARLPARERAARIAYVPQRSATGFAFTVREVVAMGRHTVGDSARAVDDALHVCELAELAGRPYNELSIGQQQRVLVARAYAQSRGGGRVMLLDEPVSAMDLAHAHRTLRLLGVLAADEGLAIVVVLQDLNLASRYADTVWLVKDGRLAACGPRDEVLREELLEPVYGVELRRLGSPTNGDGTTDGRPRFEADVTFDPPPS